MTTPDIGGQIADRTILAPPKWRSSPVRRITSRSYRIKPTVSAMDIEHHGQRRHAMFDRSGAMSRTPHRLDHQGTAPEAAMKAPCTQARQRFPALP